MSFEDFADERAWGLRPPGLPSSCHKPGWPGPPLGWWGFPPRNPNRDVMFFREAVEDIIKHMIRRGELQPGPNAPGQVVPVPLIGVTDGSQAAIGIVGEVINTRTDVPYAASPTKTETTVSIVIPPGDWNLSAWMGHNSPIGGMAFDLPNASGGTTPNIAGLSPGLAAVEAPGSGGAPLEWVTLVGANAFGNFSVPTLLPFKVLVFNDAVTGGQAGTAFFFLQARRMR